ncbi:class I tRNA ligase family protein, partial [Candidatus Bipolaricaulota bacterium]|nr:class I tRNA ligase family protein [Candidatus Bipolaricaulota bacterium]
VLDTWFSSWLWPFSIMGWPDETEDLKTYFPTDFLLTAFDILFFWVSRMIMASLHFMNEVPFKTVYITPLIVDAQGQKMSKSKGNSVDPIELMDEYGADALRLALAHATGKGRTMRTPSTQLDDARNFLNKLWNVARFVLMNLGDERPERPETIDKLEDRFILSRLSATTDTVCEHLDAYNFNLAAEALYDFVWHDFCDWYVELVKPRLKDNPDDGVKGVLYSVLRDIIKLLHPIVPHITEEIWQVLGEEPESVSRASYPEAGVRDEDAEREMLSLQEVITGVRAIRAELRVPHNVRPEVLIKAGDRQAQTVFEENLVVIGALTNAGQVTVAADLIPPEGAARKIIQNAEVFVPLTDLIDVTAEKQRLRVELIQVEKDLSQVVAKLGNEQFLKRAPADVVEREQRKRDEFSQRKERLEANLASLGG